MPHEIRRTYVVVAVIVIIAMMIMALRYLSEDTTEDNHPLEVWRLSYTVQVRSDQTQRLSVSLPDDMHWLSIQREAFFRGELAMDLQRNVNTTSRSAVLLSPGSSGWATWRAEFDIELDSKRSRLPLSPTPLKTASRQRYLLSRSKTQVGSPPVNQALAQIPAGLQPAECVRRIFEYCWINIKDDPTGQDDAASALTDRTANEQGRARAMVAMCRTAGIPARLVTGFVMDAPGPLSPRTWVQVYMDSTWVPYDPSAGHARFLPVLYVPVRLDGVEILRGDTSGTTRITYELEPLDHAQRLHHPIARLPAVLDLTRLPSSMRNTLAVLLLLPLGALVTAVFRNLVGLMTFGTFTPALLALSLLYSDPVTGTVIFVMVLFIGLLTRALLEHLQLLMVPRLGVMLSMVVICLILAISIMDELGLTPSANAVILPMVVMTMLIERFYVCRDEDGLLTACKMMGGTLIVATCCFAVLGWKALGSAFVGAPEMVLFPASGLLLLGRYSGYRLAELVRFGDLAMSNNGLGD